MPKKVKNADYYNSFEDFDTFIKNVKIPAKKWKFFENFTSEKSDTFGNAVKSYHAAGWTETTTSKYRAKDLYNSPLMQRLISLWYRKTAQKRENRSISVFDSTDNALLWCIDRAKECGDHKAVESAAMSRAKLHGQLVDKHQVIDPVTEQKISQTKQLELSKLAEARLLTESVDMPMPVIEAKLVESSEPEITADDTTNLYTNDVEAALMG